MNIDAMYSEIREIFQQLKASIERGDIDNIKADALALHSLTHFGSISAAGDTVCDLAWEKMREKGAATFIRRMQLPNYDQNVTYAWVFWHIYRIEDLVGNILIAGGEQVFNADWQQRINATITDTGNALSDAEMVQFSQQLDLDALKAYCIEVGTNTRRILGSLTSEQLHQHPTKAALGIISDVGGVTKQDGSRWLLDFWGSLDTVGLILTPLTDHHMMHLPCCLG
jgi:hypothetical protein